MLSRKASSVAETEEIAKIFLDQILKNKNNSKGALVVGLSGNLGAGKTAFTKAIAKHLRVKEKITSPTFVIIKKYPIRVKGYKFLFHLDAYRLKNEQDLLNLAWEDIISQKEHLVFIEWPENVKRVLPESAHFIYISADENGYRNLELK